MPENESALAHLEAATVAAYLDGSLPPSATLTVEEHLADCEACRSEIVQLESIVRPRPHRKRVYVAALMATAAALLLIALPGEFRLPGQPQEPSGNDALALRMRALGDVAQPPIYLGVAVRATSEQGTQLFASGMRAYTDARYAEAITDLRAARSAGVEGPAAMFFLGASHLMLGDAKTAAEEFTRVINVGQTPYLPEAHFYRAKALLRLDQFDDALTELDRSIESGDAELQTMARSFRDSLRLLRAR